jgi:glycosyltransferase involved in cell wall biosynthesis
VKEIIIIQRIFPEYRKPIFDAIHRQIDFTLLHSKNNSGIKQTSAPYSVQIKQWQYGKGDTRLFFRVFGYIKRNKPKIIIHELAVGILSLPLVVLARKIFGYKFILWGHTYNRKKGFDPQKSLSDKYRLWLQGKADAIITYSVGEKEELVRNKINSNKIFPALNTLDTNKFLPIRDNFEKTGKENVKQKLGFTHQFNLIFIGRLYEDKWPQVAIEVLNMLSKKNSLSVALHFVGSGTMESSLVEYANKNGLEDHVFFHKEIFDEYKSGELLFASDIMIMPGCVGLSVNHAFCFDCPVITFESENNIPAHGPEIEYIIHGKTGFIAKNRSVADMAGIVYNYLSDAPLQEEIKVNIRNMIEKTCPIEKLTGAFVDAIYYANKN